MSVFASIVAYDRGSDWRLALVGLAIVFVVAYPLYILYLRYTHTLGIRRQLVTSMYTLPVIMTPVELAYIFSAKVKNPQLYATLYDLANKSVLILHNKHGIVTVETGPKVDDKLHPYEKLLLTEVQYKTHAISIRKVLEGTSKYDLADSKQSIRGSRQYVFWWLLRDTLRRRGIIEKNLSKRYAMLLFNYGVLGSLAVCVTSVGVIRFSQIVSAGEVNINRLMMSIGASISIWFIMIVPMVFITFGLFKFRGRMLGRDWILTKKYRRYLGQLDAFREFVRMTHKGQLKFESKELYKEAMANTRPYAIACGYIKE